jgi:serine protease Do
VTAVDPNSPAAERGIQPGDVVQEANLQPITSVEEFERRVATVKSGDSILLLVRRDNNTLYIGVRMPN